MSYFAGSSSGEEEEDQSDWLEKGWGEGQGQNQEEEQQEKQGKEGQDEAETATPEWVQDAKRMTQVLYERASALGVDMTGDQDARVARAVQFWRQGRHRQEVGS